MILRKFDTENEELRRKTAEKIITRIEEIDGEPGLIAAEDIISIVTQNLGLEIYNMGIRDTKKLLEAKFSDLETDIDMLEQSTR